MMGKMYPGAALLGVSNFGRCARYRSTVASEMKLSM